MTQIDKIIIVEGKTDKAQIIRVLAERVTIISTYGTFSLEWFDNALETYDLDNRKVYIFVDSDQAGKKLRRQLTAELPHAIQLYVPEIYEEVATTPHHIVAAELQKSHFKVNEYFLEK